jgi:alcohol dehydrogenase
MRAMYYERFGERPTIEQLPDPVPAADGVVIEVGASGICRSDWHGWLGHDPDIALPHVPGHELAGTIVALGSEVANWRLGDRVTVPFVGGCGRCDSCASGDHQVCPQQFQPGFTHWGSFASFVAIGYADTNLVRLPDDLGFVETAALGCRVATAFRAVVERAQVWSGEWLAVHGCGGVGLSALMIGRALGARMVAVDVDSAALDAARAAGAEVVIDAAGSSPDEVAAMVWDATGGGAHASIDAIGGAAPSHASIMGLRRRGRHVQVGLMTGDAAHAPMPFGRVLAWELDVLGSHGMSARSYPAMLAMIADGRLPVDQLVTWTVSLDRAIDHLVDPNATGAGIAVIDRF